MKLDDLLSICQFKSFPFDLKPALSPEIWAGRKEILNELLLIKKNIIEDSLAEFGIVTGTYGAGKSQTLLHLRYLIQEDAKNNGYDVICAYIPNPCGLGAKQNFIENYQYIMTQGIGLENVMKISKCAKEAIQTSVSENMTKEELEQLLSNTTAQQDKYKGKYNESMADPPIPYELLDNLISGDSQTWEWISGQKAINTIGNISVQPIMSHTICARALAQLVILATKSPTPAKHGSHKAVLILVDQTENIAALSARIYQEQIAGWRSIWDEIGKSFGLIWAMDGRSQDIMANFSEAIETRLTTDPNKLNLDELYDDEPIEFLKQIIGTFRKEGAKVSSETYPFTNEALDEIVNLTPNPLPRNLLTSCRRVFTRAAADDKVSKLTDVIDPEYVRIAI